MPSTSFENKVSVGTFAEQFVLRLLGDTGIRVWSNPEVINRAAMIEWDIAGELTCGRRFTLEVKYDQMEARTGNVAVEHHNTRQDKPSGILATDSDLWVFVLDQPMTAWVCRTIDLRDWVQTRPYHRTIACGGDDNAAMYLYKRRSLFDALFTQLDVIEPWDMGSVLKKLLKGNHEPERLPIVA